MQPTLEFEFFFEKIQHVVVVVNNDMQISFCLKLSCVIRGEIIGRNTNKFFMSSAYDLFHNFLWIIGISGAEIFTSICHIKYRGGTNLKKNRTWNIPNLR